MFVAAESGLVPLSVSFAALAFFLERPNTNISVGIAFCIGRLYTLTLLLNLNIRSSSSATSGSCAAPSNDAETGISGSKLIGLRSFVTDSAQSHFGRKDNRSGTTAIAPSDEAVVASGSDEPVRPEYERQTVLDLGDVSAS